jgi:hypothetical protein
MIDHVMLTNWRRFPRARVNCNVVYGDRFQSWRSHTKDISQSGCRVIGYYPFPLGKTLSLKLTHLQVPEPVAIIGKVVRLYGGADNALGLAFEDDARTRAKFQEWMRRVVSMDPAAERTLSKMPGQLPIEAQLRRVTAKPPGRSLSAGERSVLERLDTAPRGMSLNQFRIEWGGEWERKAQVLFDLIADGIVIYTTPAADPKNAIREAAQAVNRMQTTQKLIEQLETEYGPIDQRFTQEIETITEEVTKWGAADSTKLHGGSPTHSGPKRSVAISWTSIPSPGKNGKR